MSDTASDERLQARVLRGAKELFAGEEARVARSVILQFFVTIALPVLFLLGLPTITLFAAMGADPRLWQALIAGLVIATGWLTTAIFAELGQRRAKAERLRDYHKALYAEIGNALRAIWDEGQSDAHVQGTTRRMQDDPDFVPFIPKEQHDRVYLAILDEIEVLPRQTIDAVVAYYSQMTALGHMVEDMRGRSFRSVLSQDRRIAMYEDYSSMRRQAFILGQYALELMRAYASGGAQEADRVIARVSNRGADPSDRSAESE